MLNVILCIPAGAVEIERIFLPQSRYVCAIENIIRAKGLKTVKVFMGQPQRRKCHWLCLVDRTKMKTFLFLVCQREQKNRDHDFSCTAARRSRAGGCSRLLKSPDIYLKMFSVACEKERKLSYPLPLQLPVPHRDT